MFTNSQGGWEIGIFEHLREFGKEFVANGNELVLALRTFLAEFIAMTGPAFELERCLR